MKITKITALFMFALLALVSCKKDEESVTDKLTKDTWKLVDSRFDDNGDGELTADESDLEDCDKDDVFEFHEDGELHIEDGSDKCDPADPDSETGTWTLASDNKTIVLTTDGIGFAGEITELTSSKLVIRIELEDSGVTFLTESTFGR